LNNVHDISEEFCAIVRSARTTEELRRAFEAWLREQRVGVLAPLLSDMRRLWRRPLAPPELEPARTAAERIARMNAAARAAAVRDRVTAIAGREPAGSVVLLAGFGAPEGYSRFDRGCNTVFIGLDHSQALEQQDHLELVLSHELSHSLRDPMPAVLSGYGGWSGMTHDDFVERYTMGEHFVGESLAIALSELVNPGRPDRRYVYLDEAEHAWCAAHRAAIAERVCLALERGESYRTFFRSDVVAPGAPAFCDYYLALGFGRYAIARHPYAELVGLPASHVLSAFLAPFLEELVRAPETIEAVPVASVPSAPRPAPVSEAAATAVEGTSPAIARLHAELDRSMQRARPGRDPQRELEEAVERTGLRWGGEPPDVLASPLLLGGDELESLRLASERLHAVFEHVIALYREEPEVRAYFGFPEHVERLATLTPAYEPSIPIARLDSYWDGRRVVFLELNANGTAGLALVDRLGPLYAGLPGVGEVLRPAGARSLPLLESLRTALLEAWRQARGDRELGRIAIVDWSGLSSATELESIAAWLTERGTPTVVTDPRRLSRRGGRLLSPEGEVDLVYRRLTTLDLIERPLDLAPLFEAALEDEVVTFGSYASDVAHSKKLFSFLSNERWREHFGAEELDVVDAHVPWTRILSDRKVARRGVGRAAVDVAREEREHLVLKPAEGYEGRGVLLGALTDVTRWEEEVLRRTGDGHVLQELVPAPARRFSIPGASSAGAVTRYLHLGEYLVAGRLAGLLARASRELVLSPTSTERVLPCFVLPPSTGAEGTGGSGVARVGGGRGG